MMQKMVSLLSEQPEGSLFLAAALPSLCIRKKSRGKSTATSVSVQQRLPSHAAYVQMAQ